MGQSDEMFPETLKRGTFRVGGEPPRTSTVKLKGKLPPLPLSDSGLTELMKGERLLVQVIGPDGEMLTSAYGYVRGVGFPTKRHKDLGEYTVREQTVEFADEP